MHEPQRDADERANLIEEVRVIGDGVWVTEPPRLSPITRKVAKRPCHWPGTAYG